MLVDSFILTIFLFASVPVAIIISYRSIILFILSIVFFVYVPFIIPLAYLIGVKASYNALFLWSSGLHLIVLSIFILYGWIVAYRTKSLQVFFKSNVSYFINFIIALSIFVVTFSNAYVEKYISKWENTHSSNQIHILKNLENNTSMEIQNSVRKILDLAMIPKYKKPKENIFSILENQWKYFINDEWQVVNIRGLGLDVEKFYHLRKLLIAKPSIEYKYNFKSNNKYAVVVISSKHKKGLRIIFRFSFKDTWSLDNLIVDENYDEKERLIFGDTRAIYLKPIESNTSVSDFYKEEFNKSIENFSLVSNAYEVFKGRVAYSFASQCIEKFNDEYQDLNIRKNLMSDASSDKSKELLISFYDERSFQQIKQVQKRLLSENNHSLCHEYIALDSMYALFIEKYIPLLAHSYRNPKKIPKMIEKDEASYERIKRKIYMTAWIKNFIRLKSGRKSFTSEALSAFEYVFIPYTDKGIKHMDCFGDCKKTWNKKATFFLPHGFLYTGKFIKKDTLMKLIEDEALLKFIDSQEEIEIRDIALNILERKEYDRVAMKKQKEALKEVDKKMQSNIDRVVF